MNAVQQTFAQQLHMQNDPRLQGHANAKAKNPNLQKPKEKTTFSDQQFEQIWKHLHDY